MDDRSCLKEHSRLIITHIKEGILKHLACKTQRTHWWVRVAHQSAQTWLQGEEEEEEEGEEEMRALWQSQDKLTCRQFVSTPWE